MPPKRNGFYSKNYFITYPKCSLTKEEALSQLLNIQTPTSKKYIRICRELHEDGTPHLHVLIQFEGKFKCQNMRFFDLVSPSRSAHFHPNIQGAKSSSDVKSYIEKDGDILDWGQFQIDGRSARGGHQACNGSALQRKKVGSKSEILRVIKELALEDHVLRFHNLNAKLDRKFQETPSTYITQASFLYFNQVTEERALQIIESLINVAPLVNSVIMLAYDGTSRGGKARAATSLGPYNSPCGHLVWNPRVEEDEKENIRTRVAPTQILKHFKEFMGAHKARPSGAKSGKPVRAKGGIPAIILGNPGPNSSYKEFLDEEKNSALKNWALKNATFITQDRPMYSGTNQSTAQGSEEAQQEEESRS
nr:replication initiator protein [Cotton leaf curl virus]